MEKMTRRSVLASGIGIAAMNGFLIGLAGAEETSPQEKCWKYVRISPQKAAQRVYDTFGDNGCMYGAFKGALLEYADTIADTDPQTAAAVKAIPFTAFRAGRSGFAKLKQLCGAVAGSVIFFSCFVEDFADVCKLTDQLGQYAAETSLPEFIPEKDEYPDFRKVVAHGLTCKEMGGAWMKGATEEQKKIVGERCKRHAASIMGKAVELLNEYYAE